MGEIVKIGEKQRHMQVPDGWQRVLEGKVLEDDMFANVGNPTNPHWSYVEYDDIGMDVDGFDCVIRKTKLEEFKDELKMTWEFYKNSCFGIRWHGPIGVDGDIAVLIGRWSKGWLVGILTGFELHIERNPDFYEPTRCWARFFGRKFRVF